MKGRWGRWVILSVQLCRLSITKTAYLQVVDCRVSQSNLVLRVVLPRYVTKESCSLNLGLENEFTLFYFMYI